MARRRAVVRLGVPALIVAGLALVALWRVGPPVRESDQVATTGSAAPGARAVPLTKLAELLTENAIGREASLEAVEVRQITSPRTFWVGAIDEEPAFAVLDPDVRRTASAPVAPGARVTLIGLVRPAPDPNQAMKQWNIDAATARSLQERGTYVHVTEIRGVPEH